MKNLFYLSFEFLILFCIFGISFRTNYFIIFSIGAFFWVSLLVLMFFCYFRVHSSVIGFSLYLIFIAFGRFFSDFDYDSSFKFLLYYIWFFVPGLFLLYFVYARSNFPGLGLIALGFFVLPSYLVLGLFDWNQYQSVGNITALSLLVSLFYGSRVVSTVFLIGILKIPSTQSLGISVFLLLFSRIRSRRISSLLIFVSILICCFVLIYFLGFFEPRHATVLIRLGERILIFSHYLDLVTWYPQLDWLSTKVVVGDVFITGRAHGVWLQTFLNFGWILGGLLNIILVFSVINISKNYFYLVLPFFIPFIISTDVNPLKYLFISSLLIYSLAVKRLSTFRPHLEFRLRTQ